MAKGPVFDNADFESRSLQCTSCGWSGEGRDANRIDLYGLTRHEDIHCPNCDAYIGALRRDEGTSDTPSGLTS